MVSKKHYEQDLAFARLVTNYENHSKQDEEHFTAIREQLTAIESKVDKWSWKTATMGGGMGLVISILFLVLTKIIGG